MRMATLLLVLFATCGVAVAGLGSRHEVLIPSSSSRLLQQAHSANCTPARTFNDTFKPFCFVPETISPEAKQFLSQAAAGNSPFGQPSFGTTPAEQAANVGRQRAFVASLIATGSAPTATNQLQSVRNATIANVPVVIAVPKGIKKTSPANTKVLMYLHGGGYILGSCQYQLSTAAATAAAAGLTIICPDYRLAPEHPFPAGLNDVLNVYKALINQEGYSPKNIVLLGDSAGGGLVPAMAAQLQREGVALPAALGMFSPFTDLRNAQRSDTVKTLIGVDPFIGVPDPGKPYSELESLGSVYVGNNATLLDDPLASPVLADYAALFPGGSLPPTLIQVGLRQVLLSDAIRLYHKMQAAAPAPGHVVISPYEGMWHVFQTYGNVPEAAAASKEMADYFTRALNGKICK